MMMVWVSQLMVDCDSSVKKRSSAVCLFVFFFVLGEVSCDEWLLLR